MCIRDSNLTDPATNNHNNIPCFKPLRNKSFVLKKKKKNELRTNINPYKVKKQSIKNLRKANTTYDYTGDISIISKKTPKNTDRNREGCK